MRVYAALLFAAFLCSSALTPSPSLPSPPPTKFWEGSQASGNALTVIALGSSICEKFAGNFHSSLAALTGTGVHRLGRSAWLECRNKEAGEPCRHPGSVFDLMQWINTTWPHVNHTLVNLGRASTTLATLINGACFDDQLPHKADLILFETTAGQADGAWPLERLFHVLATRQFPNSAEVILLNYLFIASMDFGCSSAEHPYNESKIRDMFREQILEDTQAAMASYYGWSSLSVRNVLWAGIKSGVPTKLGLSECDWIKNFMADRIHPSSAGAAYVGAALVQLFQRSRDFGVATQQHTEAAMASWAMPDAPLIPGNWADKATHCVEIEHLHVQEDIGWTFSTDEVHFDEKTNQNVTAYKPGWTATVVGSAMTFRTNTLMLQRQPSEFVEVHLTYLSSYQHMGVANVQCTTSCKCNETQIDAASSEKVSLNKVAVLAVTQSRTCYLKLTLLSGGKWKLVNVLVTG